MSSEILSIEKRLILTKFIVDKEPHIKINSQICMKCKVKVCIKACPAGLYSLNEKGELVHNYEGCLECGTCRFVCPHNAIEWRFPRGGFGVYYQFG